MKIIVATSQFPVSKHIESNKMHMLSQMKEAKQKGAHIIHFPEAALSGYAGVDFFSFENYNWPLLSATTKEIIKQAKVLNLWVVLDSSHFLKGNKPHNSVYIINNKGELVDRYDKRFCSGNQDETEGDLNYYSPGNHFATFEINGVKCGVLICYDYRFPELYRECKKMGVQIMFHSYHALNHSTTYPEITMPATMTSYAANNYVWISASNTSAKESCWASFMVRPDGVTIGKLLKNQTGILITEVDTSDSYYDSTANWRNRAINGQYHSGESINCNRSQNRTKI